MTLSNGNPSDGDSSHIASRFMARSRPQIRPPSRPSPKYKVRLRRFLASDFRFMDYCDNRVPRVALDVPCQSILSQQNEFAAPIEKPKRNRMPMGDVISMRHHRKWHMPER